MHSRLQQIRQDLPLWMLRWILAALLLLYIVYPRNAHEATITGIPLSLPRKVLLPLQLEGGLMRYKDGIWGLDVRAEETVEERGSLVEDVVVHTYDKDEGDSASAIAPRRIPCSILPSDTYACSAGAKVKIIDSFPRKRAFEWSDLIHSKQCQSGDEDLVECKQRQMLRYLVYFILAFTAFCTLSWIVFKCLKRRHSRPTPLLINYKSESEQSLVSRPMKRIRAHGPRLGDEEAQSNTERFVGLDGTTDGWGKWLKQKQRPRVTFSGDVSPRPSFYPPRLLSTPRIPSLILPRTTLATVRQLSGLVRGGSSETANTLREMRPPTMKRESSRLRWGSTV